MIIEHKYYFGELQYFCECTWTVALNTQELTKTIIETVENKINQQNNQNIL